MDQFRQTKRITIVSGTYTGDVSVPISLDNLPTDAGYSILIQDSNGNPLGYSRTGNLLTLTGNIKPNEQFLLKYNGWVAGKITLASGLAGPSALVFH